MSEFEIFHKDFIVKKYFESSKGEKRKHEEDDEEIAKKPKIEETGRQNLARRDLGPKELLHLPMHRCQHRRLGVAFKV